MPWLARAHAFKDKTDKGMDANVGLFDYPVLMAADILIYDAEVVPVGKDQKQHVEMAREVAQKFNNAFGDTFKSPKEFIKEDVAVVPGIDGQKMSKSYGNTIPLFGTDDEIKKAVMSIVTDSSGDTPTNVYAIHKLFRSESELAALYEEKKGKYKDLKEALLADILDLVRPMRQRRAEFEKQPDLVAKILAAGAEKARARAAAKMKLVRERVGL
jgi:tryptophanyl-tRNA synthetase